MKLCKRAAGLLLALVMVLGFVCPGAAVQAAEPYLGVNAGSQVPDSFANDLWTQYDFKELQVGETATITPRRVPEAITDAIGNDVNMPHFCYRIISGNSVELTGSDNLHQGVTAVAPGNTVIAITYDELVHANGGTVFPACDPVNTQYVVFSVGGNSAITVADNICAESVSTAPEGKVLYRSYDTMYFAEGDHVDFDLAVTADGAESVAVKCNGMTVAEGAQGHYVLPLENRNNIVEITATAADGSTRSLFHVLAARKVEILVSNKTNPGQPLTAGDTANISFRGVKMPVYKLATIYNPQWTNSWGGKQTYAANVNYVMNGKTYRGVCQQYDLATNNDFDITFEQPGSYSFGSGKVDVSWFGSPLGTDKGQDSPGAPNMNAPTTGGSFSFMPDFTVNVAAPEYKATVNLSMEMDNFYLVIPHDMEISSTLSDTYGYVDEVTDGVSVLDALIAMHELNFGSFFTPEDKDEYLKVEGGFITTIMGEQTSDVGFLVNGFMPNDGVINDAYGTYTGYAVNQAKLRDHDTLQFFFYNPDGYYGEIYTNFLSGEEHITELTMVAGIPQTLKVQGYSVMYEGMNPVIKWKNVTDKQVCTLLDHSADAGSLIPISGAVTDDNGQFQLTLNAVGHYMLAVNSDPDNLTYIVPQICHVNVVPGIQVTGTNMTLGNTLAMNFMIPKADAADLTGLSLQITKTFADGREPVVVTVPAESWKDYNKDFYAVTFTDISAKEMTDGITAQVLRNGKAAGKAYTDSVEAYALRILRKTETVQELKAVIVDMLNYGAEAQKKFDYHPDALAGAQLTAEEKALASDAVTAENVQVRGEKYFGSNLNLGSNLALTVYFKGITPDMHATVSYTKHSGQKMQITVSGDDFVKYNDTVYGIRVDSLVVADARQPVTVTVYDAENNVTASGTDSIASYVARSSSVGELGQAILKFTASAEVYFANR